MGTLPSLPEPVPTCARVSWHRSPLPHRTINVSYSTDCTLPNFPYLFSCLSTCQSAAADSAQPPRAPPAFPNTPRILHRALFAICIRFSTLRRAKPSRLSVLSFGVGSLEGRHLARPRGFFTSFPVLGSARLAHSCLRSAYLTMWLFDGVQARSLYSLMGRVCHEGR